MGKNIHTLEDIIQPMTSVEVIVLWFNLLDNTGSLLKLFVQRGSDIDSFECGATKVISRPVSTAVVVLKAASSSSFLGCVLCAVNFKDL